MLKVLFSLLKKIKNIIGYYKKYFAFKKINDNRFETSYKNRKLCLGEASQTTGFDSHYLYHTSWAARVLAETKPLKHYDIGSCLRFATIVSAFLPIHYYDFRPPKIHLSNLEIDHADITSLPFNDNSIKSISCMHVLEHIGLGRYGDKIDPQGDLKGVNELTRVLKNNGGQLLIVIPISGEPRIEFNAHRIYSYDMIINMFSGLNLVEFSLFSENSNELIINASRQQANKEKYGCGCFYFIKG